MHTINLSGYTVSPADCRFLWLGTAESYGTEMLKIIADPAWDGLTITATFVTANSAVKVLAESDGTVKVPPEATACAAELIPARIVFAGVADGVQRISCDLPYKVADHASIDGVQSRPTPNEWQQYIAEVEQIVNKAVPLVGNVGQVLTKTKGGSEWADLPGGSDGNGATFTPQVSTDGVISWTNDKNLQNPEPMDIKGESGLTPQLELEPDGNLYVSYIRTENERTR